MIRTITLHGDIVHEDRPFITNAVDVRCFSNHQAEMVNAMLHPTNVVAHYEEDVWFPRRSRLCMCGHTSTSDQSSNDRQTAGEHSTCQAKKIRLTVHGFTLTILLMQGPLSSDCLLGRWAGFVADKPSTYTSQITLTNRLKTPMVHPAILFFSDRKQSQLRREKL